MFAGCVKPASACCSLAFHISWNFNSWTAATLYLCNPINGGVAASYGAYSFITHVSAARTAMHALCIGCAKSVATPADARTVYAFGGCM